MEVAQALALHAPLTSATGQSELEPPLTSATDLLATYSKQFEDSSTYYKEKWKLADLEDSITALEGALSLLRSGQEPQPPKPSGVIPSKEPLDLQSARLHLSYALGERYQHIGLGPDTPDLDKQIQLLHECVAYSSDDDDLIHQLATALRVRASHECHFDDAFEAKSLLEALLPKFPSASAFRSRVLCELGRVHTLLFYNYPGHFGSLDQSISLLEEARTMDTSSVYDQFCILTRLGFAYQSKYRRTEDISLLHKAKLLHLEALQLLSPNHRGRHLASAALGGCCVWLYDRTGDAGVIQEAINELRKVIHGRDVRSPSYIPMAKSLATALRMRYLHFGNLADLDEAIRILQPLAHPNVACSPKSWAINAGQLAFLLGDRYDILGIQDDSEEGIRLIRRCLDIRPPGDPWRHTSLVNLAGHLYSRFERTKDIGDVRAAVDAYRETIDDFKSRGSNRFAMLSAICLLIEVLRCYYQESRQLTILQEALDLCQDCLQDTSPLTERSIYPELLYQVAETYMCYYSSLGDVSALNFAITQYNESIAQFHDGQPRKYKAIIGLSVALKRRFDAEHDQQDVRDARNLLFQTLSNLPVGHTDRVSLLCESALLSLQHGSEGYNVRSALGYLSGALQDVHHSPQKQLNNTQRVLDAIESQPRQLLHDSATLNQLLDVYSSTIKLLPRVAYFGLDFASRLRALSGSANLAVRAAFHAINVDKPGLAIELLEQGRAVFWLQHLQLRGAFHGLPGDLASQLKQKAAMIEHKVPEIVVTADTLTDNSGASLLEVAAAGKRRLGEEIEDLIRQVRSQPGYERFLSRDTIAELSAGATKGAIVVYLSGEATSHAIIIEKPGVVQHVSLPQVSLNAVLELASSVDTAIKLRRSRLRDRSCRVYYPRSGAQTTEQVLASIWRQMVQPIVFALDLKKVAASPDRPRLTFCPTGAFSHLPLHAAASFAENSFRVVTSLSDYCLASYTPTIGALLEAQGKVNSVPISDARALLAAVSRPRQWTALPCAIEETLVVQQVLQRRVPVEVISDSIKNERLGNLPTVDAMLGKLPTASVIHLACHGYQDPTSPLDSGFVMSNGMLTVKHLLELKLDAPILAFLSACETAKGDKRQPDQVLHLAAAMLFAGFQSVIGTMWSMDDVDGPEVAMTVYEELFKPGLDTLDADRVPFALDLAVRKLRDRQLSASRWAPYVYYGA